ncbi:AraC-like ligand-binding domain-containing protein [Streptomyces sp. NPDC002644]
MLLLDLDTVAPEDRVDAFHHALTNDNVPNRIVHEKPHGGVRARMEAWRVGGLPLLSTRNTGFSLHRTDWHMRRQRSRPGVSVSLQRRGVGRAEMCGRQQLLGPGDVTVFHELVPRVYGWSGDGASQVMLIDADDIALPVELVAKAALRLRASPLHDLVLGHLRELWRDPGRLEADPAADALARSTTDLVRALLVSAARDRDDTAVRSVMGETVLTRAMSYARQHLGDPGLTPERIAVACSVSVRQLYQVLRREGVALEQWIIAERLGAARALLASPRHDTLTVAAVAARCGITDASWFARRFRAAYGMSPREFRRHGRGGPGA